jgi:hypothetical protein
LPGQGATTNAGDPHQKHGKGPSEPLVSPDFLLSAVSFEVLGHEKVLGRDTLRACADRALRQGSSGCASRSA